MSEEKKVKKPKSKVAKIIEWVITGVFGILFIFVFAGFIDGMVHKKANCGETLRFGWGTFIVQTDSMADHIPVKSAIITHKDSLESVIKKFSEYEEYNIGKAEEDQKGIDVSFFDIDNMTSVAPYDTVNYNDRTSPRKKVMTHRLREVHINETVKYGEGRYIFVASGTNPGNDQQKGQYQVFTEKTYLGVVKMCSNFLGGLFSFISSIWGLLILLLVPAFYLVVVSVLDIFKAYKDVDEPVVATQNADGTPVTGGKLDGLSAAEREKLKQELLQEMIDKKTSGGNK